MLPAHPFAHFVPELDLFALLKLDSGQRLWARLAWADLFRLVAIIDYSFCFLCSF